MKYSVKKLTLPEITRNSVALGALCYLLDLPLLTMKQVLGKVFENKKPEANIKLAEIGYDHLALNKFRHSKKIQPSEPHGEFLDGNMAFSRGLLKAGLDFYVGYPMTPASTILHYLAREQKKDGLKVIQPESELSVINMALGMSYAGKRVAVGSATGGFALMQEAFSFAGMAEFPLVVAVSQRQAPATGVPTHSSQSDLRFVIHAGHGEFPRIVIAPGDPVESFRAGDIALNLAWKFQVPVIVLLDKILSEHMMTCSIDYDSVYIDKGKIAENTNENYGRYEYSEDGISPLAFPGTPNTIVKVTSYEHDEEGITTEETEEIKRMIEKEAIVEIAFSTIDIPVPVDGSLSKILEIDLNRDESNSEKEISSDKFSLAHFIENEYTNIDLFERTREFSVCRSLPCHRSCGPFRRNQLSSRSD